LFAPGPLCRRPKGSDLLFAGQGGSAMIVGPFGGGGGGTGGGTENEKKKGAGGVGRGGGGKAVGGGNVGLVSCPTNYFIFFFSYVDPKKSFDIFPPKKGPGLGPHRDRWGGGGKGEQKKKKSAPKEGFFFPRGEKKKRGQLPSWGERKGVVDSHRICKEKRGGLPAKIRRGGGPGHWGTNTGRGKGGLQKTGGPHVGPGGGDTGGGNVFSFGPNPRRFSLAQGGGGGGALRRGGGWDTPQWDGFSSKH